MQNSRHQLGVDSFPEVGDDPSYPKNVIIITQFEGKHNSNRIVNIMKKYQNEKTKTSAKVSTKGFKFKHTEEEEAYELSGYEFNEITPFFMGEADKSCRSSYHKTSLISNQLIFG